MAKYTQLAEDIVDKVGGKENVKEVRHCVTRLRFYLKDESKVDTEYLKNRDGVVTVMKAYPASPNPLDVMESVHKDHENLFFSDVQICGKYTAYTKCFFKENNIHVEMAEGDEATLAAHPVDFIYKLSAKET